MPALRDYQATVADRIERLLREGKQSICLQMATGSGKTVVAGALSERLAPEVCNQESRAHILYLTHRRELVDQVGKTLADFGLYNHVGYIQSGSAMVPYMPLQIGSIPTVYRRLDKLGWLKPILIVIDEAHHIRASTWEKILERFEGVSVLGMTATPARLDGKGLGKHFDTLISGPTIDDLIEQKYLCDLDILKVPVGTDFSSMRKQMGDLSKSDGERVMTRQVIANTIDNWERYASHCRTIHYAFTVAHSERFVNKLTSRGYRAKHVDAKTPKQVRKVIFHEFSTGATQIISNVDIVTEGFDCPACDCVVLGRKTISIPLFLQMVGRVMRPKSDGRDGIVLDVSGCVNDLGDPRDARKWTLADGIVKTPGEREARERMAPDDTFNESHIPHEVDIGLVREEKRFRAFGRTIMQEIMSNLGDEAALSQIAAKYALNEKKMEMLKNKIEATLGY